MRYGFFSDAHGDVKAVKDAVAALHDVDEILFLGDITGGEGSEACIDYIRSLGIPAVIGNHDMWMGETKRLSQESRVFLDSLPLCIEREDFLAIHSMFDEENGEISFYNVQSSYECRQAFSRHPHPLIFMGHTHIASVNRLQDGTIDYTPLKKSSVMPRDRHSRYLVNTGMATHSVIVYDSAEDKLYARFHQSGTS